MAKANNDIAMKLAKEEELKKEIKLIKDLIKDVDKKKIKGLSTLIERTAFMAIKLRELEVTINKDGMTCTYQHGENQSGVKKSAEMDIYSTLIKNYVSAMSKILEQSPKGQTLIDDGFEGFVNGKSKK